MGKKAEVNIVLPGTDPHNDEVGELLLYQCV